MEISLAARADQKTPVKKIYLIELGCFDGRALEHLPDVPNRYVGLDADWEGGLSVAQRKFAGRSDLTFLRSISPDDLRQFSDNSFNAAVSLETLEHVPPELVGRYLQELSRVVDGYIFISVPNEKGPILAIKYLAKCLLGARAAEDKEYTIAELINATLGRMAHVKRREHKGFDHDALRQQIEPYFQIVSVSGGPIPLLPPNLNLTVAIVGRSYRE